jgi:hypothetical protein
MGSPTLATLGGDAADLLASRSYTPPNSFRASTPSTPHMDGQLLLGRVGLLMDRGEHHHRGLGHDPHRLHHVERAVPA